MANVAPFTFLTTTYNKNIKIMQERLVTKRKQRSDESIVFLNRDFKVGEKLTFRIESADTSPTDQPGISFTFGTTTCDMDKVCNDPCHSFAVCKPGTPCGGRSAVFMIRNCDRVGNHVTFERVPDQEGFVKIMLFRTVIGMRDFKQVFVNNAKAHPFVILDGNVESLRIVNESVLPNVGPMGRRTPGTPSSFPGGNHSNLSFLLPPYRNDSMRLQDNNKTARRVTAGVDGRIVYLNKPLELGVKLIIKIEQVLTQSPIGMVFGVTSCSLQKIRELDCHVLSMCSSSSCNGQSIHFPVQDCQQAGGIIVFERMPRGVIQVTSGANVRNTSFIPFPSAIPFFMLTGCVDAIRIFSDPSSLPNTRVFHKTPPRFTPGNQSGQGQGNQTGSRTGYRGPRRTPTFAKANHSQVMT